MSQEEKKMTETSNKNFYQLSLAQKVKKHTKMINILGFSFFFQRAKPTCSFSM